MKKTIWVLGLVLAAQAAGGEARTAITVQVVNNANVAEGELRRAKAEAGWMFERAGIEVRWTECGGAVACKAVDEPMLFVLSITAGGSPNGSETALGYALMQGNANHAAVLYPRIAALVESNPEYRDSTVLGSVMAHELGHLVFRSTRHGGGVMRAKWERDDYRAMAQRKLTFTEEQARTLKNMLAQRAAEVQFAGGRQ